MESRNKSLLSLAALGVVYGDVGTSPLYALHASLKYLPITPENVLGVCSLIIWALIIVISGKYIGVILRVDNDGEGGVLAQLALLKQFPGFSRIFFWLGAAGAGFLLSDGMLTPAISVVSAIEGLEVISPMFSHLVLPLTVSILLLLFLGQRTGTEKIGKFFGPIIVIWFATLGALGWYQITQNSLVFSAINPIYAVRFFQLHGMAGFPVLGSVFLAVTGGEALYADMGHFGRRPIQNGWFVIVLPGLVLNYLGQGAYLLGHPEAISNPFYAIAPRWFLYPYILLAALATIIASQAVISATFSLTKQAILLNLCPRLRTIQTSAEEKGQIYVPFMNSILMVGALLLVGTFQTSNALAGAYGVSVNLDMMIVTLLSIQIARHYWDWPYYKVMALFSPFLVIDGIFLCGNIPKIPEGGWVPLVFALGAIMIMYTWYKGSHYLKKSYYFEKTQFGKLIDLLDDPARACQMGNTTVFITSIYDRTAETLRHYLETTGNKSENLLILTLQVEGKPYIPEAQRFRLTKMTEKFYQLTLRYGFMQTINVPKALELGRILEVMPFEIDNKRIYYLLENLQLILLDAAKSNMFYWQKQLFAFMLRNIFQNIQFLQLPPERTLSIGAFHEI